MIKITFPDGNFREYEKGISIEEIAQSISPGLRKKSVAGYVNDELYDFNRPINEDADVRIITKTDKEAFSILNHSSAHLMAHAIKTLYPDALFGVGPDVEEGFYYDVMTEENITIEDLPRIEKAMKNIVSQALPIERRIVTRDEALELFETDKYKAELVHAIPSDEAVSVYSQGDFVDVCRGGHMGNTKHIKHFKLLSVAGAYWRGNSDNDVLTRIYGTSWFTKDDLQNHLQILEERKERDHRKIGKELKIFTITEETGKGLALWLPNGYTIRKTLEDYTYNLERKNGYKHVSTPVVGSKKLYEISGHWAHYQENMFPLMERDGEEFVLRPMSCPHHMMVYKSDLRSYRDLPIRYAENVSQYRYEASGALTGIERVRGMNLTDSHIFARPDQIKDEFKSAFRLVNKAIGDLGLEIDYVELALRDADKGKYHDDDQLWDNAENTLREVLNELGVEYTEIKGEAAFYGPKVDIQVRTALNHIITMSTIQLDFLLPERFDLTYIAEGGVKERPVVIHRGLISTYERLISILLEQYKGAFPTWLAPVQVKVIPVSLDVHCDYSREVYNLLFNEDVRVEQDLREEKLGYKIREAQTNKIPYQLVIGDKEKANRSVTYRKFGSQDQVTVSLDEFKALITNEIKERIL